jgi:hypothetical protein
MVFKPRRAGGVLVGIAIILTILALDALLLSYLRWGQISLIFFVFALLVLLSLPVLALLGYLVYALWSLRYHLHRDALTIFWGAIQHVIPMGSIREVVRGAELEGQIEVRGVRWPGHLLGRGQIEGVGPTRFYATEPATSQLLVVTPPLAYGISPANAEGFLDAFEIRQRMGPLHLVSHEQRQPGFLSWPFWRDQLAHLSLGLGLLLNVALFGYLCWRYPALAQIDMFKLPAIGLGVWIVNASLGVVIHARQRVAAHLLWAGAVAVQFLCWLAVLNVT